MGFSLKTKVMLWGRSASRCAYCQRQLEEPTWEGEDVSLVGEACHIVAQASDGPRGDADFPAEARDRYDNLLLLCNIHHKLIDDHPEIYTVEKLHEMKTKHEEWVKASLGYDEQKQKDDEYYTMVIQKWEEMCGINEWDFITSAFFYSAANRIKRQQYDMFRMFTQWLKRRHWPKSNIALEKSFRTFSTVLHDMLNIFTKYIEEVGEDYYKYEKFYRLGGNNVNLRDKLSDEYDYNVALLCDMFCELTRAGNWIIDNVRASILPGYRNEEGRLAIVTGDVLSHNEIPVTYQSAELIDGEPYPGLLAFKKTRSQRDYHYGQD